MKIFPQIRSVLAAAALASVSASLGCQVCPCSARGPATVAAATAPGTQVVEAARSVEGSKAVKSAPYVWKNVTILGGGFVSGIVFSPVAKDLVYARTDVGGAYRYDPANTSWTPITDMFPRDTNFLGIESIAADPVDANKVYAAVGTYTQSWSGNGAMLRSTDKGQTWQRTDMPIKMGGNENGRSNGERLAIDPRATNILFFGSRKNGLWKSTDGSVTWAKVDSFPVSSDPNAIGIVFVLFDPKSGGAAKPTPHLYAAVAKTDGTLYESSDGGTSWKLVPKQPMNLMASHAAFDSNGVLYVSYGSGPGPNDVVDGAVWAHDAKKGSWTNISPVAPGGADKFGYGGLSVDAQHAGTIMVTTIDRWSKGDEIYRSTNGGKSWKAIGAQAVRDEAGAHYLYWDHDKPTATGWAGDIDIDPFNPGRVMYVTGQGVWATSDATAADGDKPTHWKFLDRGLEETVIAGLVSPPSGPPLLSAVGDLGGFRHDDLDKPSPQGMFKNPIFGSGTGIDVAWQKPEIVVRAGHAGWGSTAKRGALSLDSGNTWAPFASEPPGNGAGSIAVSADGSAILWSPKDGPTAVSRDRGATWTRAGGLPDPAKVQDWAPVSLRPAADRVNPQKLYAYDSMKGRAYTSSDGGAHFTESTTGMPTLPDYNLGSGSIQAAPGTEGDVWLTTGKEVFHSTDSGKTYQSLSNVDESNAIGFGKAAQGQKYPAVYLIGKVGGVAGFFRSDDGGTNWVRINDEQHQFGFTGVITGDPRVYGRVYIGTGGRGILYGDPK
jgi:photosystem II stability/assembly factor-like uncharacterized protein